MIQEFSNKNIIIVTGGTGGHIYPAITFGKYLTKKYFKVTFITDKRGLANKNLSSLKPYLINVKGFAGKTVYQKIISISLIFISFLKSLIFLLNKKTDLVLGFGSYVQVPVILAAKILHIKIILHEANLVLGNANKYLWNFAKVRAAAFNIINSSKHFAIVGMPVRNEIEILAKRIYKSPKKSKKINILILGGSLGAQILSRNMCSQMCMLPENIKKRLHINHQVKEEDIIYISKKYKKNQISANVQLYFHEIHKQFKYTTLVICRAGASTIAENLVTGLPAIYIPLANSINNHQKHNAQMISRLNAGRMILENEISKNKFLELLIKLFNSKILLEEISNNCKRLSSPDSSKKLYTLVLETLSE